ncbi:hypothetical protein LEN26_006630 [Aphanomyces euteiches]|nr:hypothetical protein AeMF1_000314 [Aphanomyces euteiches]KAH9135004.1 hypothetical protein LEN26_006630 [Aphanomyces euteiches]KAH9191272.1 hypothetical protein AeNC1_006757 [Aphanomyces euteiches]
MNNDGDTIEAPEGPTVEKELEGEEIQSDVPWTTDDDNDGVEDEEEADDENGFNLDTLEEVKDEESLSDNADNDGDEKEPDQGTKDIEEAASNDAPADVQRDIMSDENADREADKQEEAHDKPRSKKSKRRKVKTPEPDTKEAADEKAKPKKKAPRRDRSPPRDGFFKKEREYIALSMKKMRAIRRKAPVQVRIFTEPRKILSPMDKYVCALAEPVCSDIFWSSMKNDMIRLRHLVKVEGISVHNTLDPWLMHQTPLHWAAKGGAVEAIEFLLECGADVYKKDDNGSIPLHLACWAGHTQAAMALLRAGDLKDLLIADYDANLNALEWARVRQHTQCVADLDKFCDSVWLPKFVADLIWKIISKTKMKTAEEKAREEKIERERAEFKRLQELAEQAKAAAQMGQAVHLDSSDATKITFSALTKE